MIRDSETDPSGRAHRVVVYVSSDEGSSESDPDDGCDDDECLVLDEDPDKPVLVWCDPCHVVQVVAEKGQIACRDYPHARHNCVKFPFKTTPHEKHCDLCHSYVCDSLAPCISWGMGQLDQDHCHATDQDEDWNARRKTSIPGKSIPAELRMHMKGLKM